MIKILITIFILISFFNNAHANSITLFCIGQVNANNASGQKRSGQISTTVVFNEETRSFRINNTSDLQKFAVFPYKTLNFSDENIRWETSIDPFFGNGYFYGSINRKTGEMITHYFVIEKIGGVVTGGFVSISGSLICDKQEINRF